MHLHLNTKKKNETYINNSILNITNVFNKLKSMQTKQNDFFYLKQI